jgi:hypothetical protein
MKIGFTGTRKGMTSEQKTEVRHILELLMPSEAHHGDCIGADTDFHELVLLASLQLSLNTRIIIHPPIEWKHRARLVGYSYHEPKPYLDRNKDIVNDSHFMIATPEGPEKTRSGTWSTVRYARGKNRPIVVVYPNGTRIPG